ncbi:MAG: protein-tyrosine-phosphatase [Acetobacteraceae bacterium]|nr:protein-tyrosine-phosphatase [Acetobacteraceae bacterium]
MIPDPPFQMTVCGIDELPTHCAAGVTHVLSILDPGYPVPDAFGSFGEHARLELRFLDVIEPSASEQPPRDEHVRQILALGRDLVSESREQAHLLVHCHAGVSRSTASMLLVLAQACPKLPPQGLADMLIRIREKAWPNLRMVTFGDDALRRRGTLIEAAAQVYRYQLSVRPQLAETMTQNGRWREVQLARQPVSTA